MQNPLKYFGLSLLALLGYGISLEQPQQEIRINGYAQGTTYSVSYFAADTLVSKKQIDSILNVIDLSMSLYKNNSIINQFNQSAEGIKVDEHLTNVIQKAFVIYQDTQGLFDVTVAPLVQLWGFGPQKINTLPDSATIKQVLPAIGMDKLELKGKQLSKYLPAVKIDLNGIAQGYTVDVLANFLTEKNIHCFVVEVGGELRAKGPKPDGKPIKIGIEGPTDQQLNATTIKHVIAFKDGAVTTSGNYQKYIKTGKQTISHLINPKTGYPLANEMVSVTVFAADGLTADGYDNALMAMNLNTALKFVEARKDLAAYFIYQKSNGKIADTMTNNFKQLLWLHP